MNGSGICKSTDGGQNWVDANTGAIYKEVYALSINAASPQILYAGTTGGVLKSVNGGGNWAASNTRLTSTSPFAIRVNPSSPQTLYAATSSNGLFRTTNGGSSWSAANPQWYDGAIHTVYDVIIDPSLPATVYQVGFGLFKSTNGGSDWTSVSTPPASTCLAVDPSNAQVLYAGSYLGVYKSTNGGANWLATGFPRYIQSISPSVYNLAIDPASSQTLYANAQAGSQGYVAKSTDGGGNWATTPIDGVYYDSYSRMLTIDPGDPQTVYTGDGGKLLKSTDGGSYFFKVGGELALSGTSLSIDANSSQTLYAAGGDNDELFKSTDGGDN